MKRRNAVAARRPFSYTPRTPSDVARLQTDHQGARSTAAAGFTLLETLIAVTLVSALMLLAWSLFSVYAKLDQRGHSVAVELQLVRSLMRQMQSDLDHVVAPAATNNESEPTTSAREAGVDEGAGAMELPPIAGGFVGSANRLEFLSRLPHVVEVSNEQTGAASGELRYSTFQVVTYEWLPPPDLVGRVDSLETFASDVDDVSDLAGDNSLSREVPDFATGAVDDVAAPEPRVGLVRRARRWFEVTRARRRARMVSLADSDQTSPPTYATGDVDRLTTSEEVVKEEVNQVASQAPRFQTQQDRVPEVIKLQFRYFDGTAWRLNWDGGPEGMLPRAIEVAFDLDPEAPNEQERLREMTPDERERLLDAEQARLRPSEATSEEELPSESPRDPTALRAEYRFVISLPAAMSATDARQEAGLQPNSPTTAAEPTTDVPREP